MCVMVWTAPGMRTGVLHSTMLRLLLVATFVLCLPYIRAAKQTPPNILVLYADDLGIGDVGCFGNDTIRTPNIDGICRQGAKLTQHLTGGPSCTPSRAAMLTGRYPIRSGLASHRWIPIVYTLQNYMGLPANETTFPKLLQGAGYKTGLIGKWHLGMHCERRGDFCHSPTAHGFDYYFGTLLTNQRALGCKGDGVVFERLPWLKPASYTSIISGLLAALFLWRMRHRAAAILFTVVMVLFPAYVVIFFSNQHILDNGLWRNTELVEQPPRLEGMSQRLVNEGVRFLGERKEDGRPFFLMMSWLQVHTAMHAGPPFTGGSKHGPYGDEVEELDWSVGQIIEALRRMGLDKNTLVYFSSDNGGHLEEMDVDGNLVGGHNGIYRGGKFQGGQEGGIRVPTAVMWPGRIPPGSVIDAPTSQMDLFNTVLSLAGVDPPSDRVIDGKDITTLLTGKQKASPHDFMFHYCGTEVHAIRHIVPKGGPTYKLHLYWPDWDEGTMGCYDRFACTCYDDHHKLETPRLYNMDADPSEQHELDVTHPVNANLVKVIMDAHRRHKDNVDDVPNQFHRKYSMYRPWLQHCCNFPYCHCEDSDNALNMKM